MRIDRRAPLEALGEYTSAAEAALRQLNGATPDPIGAHKAESNRIRCQFLSATRPFEGFRSPRPRRTRATAAG